MSRANSSKRSRQQRRAVQPTLQRAVTVSAAAPRLLPLGALAAGFGMLHAGAMAQSAPAVPAAAASAPRAAPEVTMAPIKARTTTETDATSVRALTTTIGKGTQDIRDIPQSLTVMTEKLLEDRHVDTLKQALKQTGGISFLAAEGGEEDIRLRGFSLAASGDIYIDGLRDPAFYDRDTFAYDRIEVLRGSASMLFGRGSTGGVVNQVHKMAFLSDAQEVNFSFGSGDYRRFTGDFNVKTGEKSALRINVMKTDATQWGNFIDKSGLAVNYRWNVGTDDEFYASGYYLDNHNGINYGLPWLRVNAGSSNPSVLIPGIDPKNYYQAPSDYNDGTASYATIGHTHRFGGGGELKTTVRTGFYTRDQRAGVIRFTGGTPSINGPLFVTPATALSRGTQNKIQDLHSTYVQSDYSNTFNWFGLKNDVLTGIDLAKEERKAYNGNLQPLGVTLTKANTTIGSPNDGVGGVNEALRLKQQNAGFDAKSIGVYFQDMVQVAEYWKVLAGLRYDKFDGTYKTYATSNSNPAVVGNVVTDYSRSDGLWSKRVGVLFQPSDTQTYYFSWGTSFNTSGDAFQYDAPGSNTPPEKSRNIEVGTKLDLFDGRMSVRAAAFQSTKYNERNRDSPANVPLVDYLLSGKRHAAGLDLDIAGRITQQWEVWGSYAWIPSAKIDIGNPLTGTAESGERVGDRPSLTPRHSGSLWTSYQLTQKFRAGIGANARSSQTPNRNPAGIVAPHFVTGDLMAEYLFSDQIGLRVNVNNFTNKYYAETLYTAHYTPGAPRTVLANLTVRF